MIDLTNLPALDNLKSNANNQTTQISLRVKETTRALFELEARRSNLSVNSLISELLDTYAVNVIQKSISQSKSKLQVLEHYLENAAKKAGQLDSETLLYEVIERYHFDALFEGMYYSSNSEPAETIINGEKINFSAAKIDESQTFKVLIHDFAMWAEGKPTHYFGDSYPYFYVADGIVYAVPLDQPARVETNCNLAPEEMLQFDIKRSSIDCFLRADYFIIFMAIISTYESKLTELYPDHVGYLGEQTYRIIVQFANIVKDRAEFATLVVKAILKSFGDQLPKDETTRNNSAPTTPEFLVMALEELGGSAHRSIIIKTCDRLMRGYHARDHYKDQRSFEASLQGTLESCSKDCNSDTKRDYFRNPQKGEGYWHLNPGVHYDRNLRKIVIS